MKSLLNSDAHNLFQRRLEEKERQRMDSYAQRKASPRQFNSNNRRVSRASFGFA